MYNFKVSSSPAIHRKVVRQCCCSKVQLWRKCGVNFISVWFCISSVLMVSRRTLTATGFSVTLVKSFLPAALVQAEFWRVCSIFGEYVRCERSCLVYAPRDRWFEINIFDFYVYLNKTGRNVPMSLRHSQRPLRLNAVRLSGLHQIFAANVTLVSRCCEVKPRGTAASHLSKHTVQSLLPPPPAGNWKYRPILKERPTDLMLEPSFKICLGAYCDFTAFRAN